MLPPFVPPSARVSSEWLPSITKFVVDRSERAAQQYSPLADLATGPAVLDQELPSIDEFVLSRRAEPPAEETPAEPVHATANEPAPAAEVPSEPIWGSRLDRAAAVIAEPEGADEVEAVQHLEPESAAEPEHVAEAHVEEPERVSEPERISQPEHPAEPEHAEEPEHAGAPAAEPSAELAHTAARTIAAHRAAEEASAVPSAPMPLAIVNETVESVEAWTEAATSREPEPINQSIEWAEPASQATHAPEEVAAPATTTPRGEPIEAGSAVEVPAAAAAPESTQPVQDEWVAAERDAFNWQGIASLAAQPDEARRASEEWSSTEWERSGNSVNDHVAGLLVQVARQVRMGQLTVFGATRNMSTEAALAAVLSTLLAGPGASE